MAKSTGVKLVSNGDYWQAQWTDSNGQKRAKSLGSKKKLSRRAATTECRKIADEHAITPARRDVRQAPTLGEWIKQYMGLRTDYAGTTRAIMDQVGDLLKERMGEDRRIDRISRADAADWRAWLAERGITESTVRKLIRGARTIFGTRHGAMKYDFIPFNPFDREVAAPPALDDDIHYVTVPDLEKLLDACPDTGWKALLGLCRLAGLRLGEAIRLRWQHVNFEARTLKVYHKGRQTTKRRKRIVPIQPRLYEILIERFGEAQEGDRTVTGLSPNNLTRNFQAIIKRAELEEWDKLYHTLRKNLETDWLAIYPVMDVCRWLGHDPAVAAKHYHQVKTETLDRVTGRAAEREATELEQARAEIQRLRRRCRRIIQLAKEARKA